MRLLFDAYKLLTALNSIPVVCLSNIIVKVFKLTHIISKLRYKLTKTIYPIPP